jgi:DNA-binding MarR family transcriptional regulator
LPRAFSSEVAAGSREENASRKSPRLDLFRFTPFRLNPLGFRNDACSAQYISDCTRTHKSTISRAVTALMVRQIVERVENADDRREFRLRLTRKGKTLYEELIPRLLRKEQEILACLSAQERKELASLLGKIERSLDLVQTSQEADAKQAY